MQLKDTPITAHTYHGVPFYLKRDDLLHPQFSGNKARKLMALLNMPSSEITTLISYGSVQSNAMYSLAALSHLKGWKFEFYTDHIPSWLKENPIGNYQAALALGMQLITTGDIADSNNTLTPEQYIAQHRTIDDSCYLVPEGGRSPIAEVGISQLADEIRAWIAEQANSKQANHSESDSRKNKPWVVALPSGTGTTALYLAKHLHADGVEVITCACVGGNTYLKQQFAMLSEPPYPTIIPALRKHHFGKLYAQDYQEWQSLFQQTQIEFDLLYDPYMWQCLTPWLTDNPDVNLIYIHQGGLLGNQSMLPRYQRKYPD